MSEKKYSPRKRNAYVKWKRNGDARITNIFLDIPYWIEKFEPILEEYARTSWPNFKKTVDRICILLRTIEWRVEPEVKGRYRELGKLASEKRWGSK